MFQTPQVGLKPRRRSSFFGFDPPPSTNTSLQEKEAEELYLKKLTEEEKEWPVILKDCNIKVRDFWREQKEIMHSTDNSVLSKEKQEYLSKAVNVNEYLKETNSFCRKVDEYITQKQWLYRRYDHLMSTLEDNITESLRQTIAEQ